MRIVSIAFRRRISVLLLPVMFIYAFMPVSAYDELNGTMQATACSGNPAVPGLRSSGFSAAFTAQPSSVSHCKLSSRQNPIQYSGYYYDRETGFFYCKARYYSPVNGRFISRDTYDLDNRYMYCGANPVNNIDPGGHSICSILLFGLGLAGCTGGVAGSIISCCCAGKIISNRPGKEEIVKGVRFMLYHAGYLPRL